MSQVTSLQRVLVGAAGVLMLSYGARLCFGLFVQPMSADFAWPLGVMGMAIGVQSLVWGLFQPLCGLLADRYGARYVALTAGVLYATGVALMLVSSNVWMLNFSIGLLVGIALAGTGFPVLLGAVAKFAPPADRGRYLGFASAGGSLGQLLLVPAVQTAIGLRSWQGGSVLLAVAVLGIVPLAILLPRMVSGRDAPAPDLAGHLSLGATLKLAIRDPGFWLLNAGFAVCGFHVTFIGTYLPPYLADKGLAPLWGAVGVAMIGLGNMCSTIASGRLADFFQPRVLLCGFYVVRGVVMVGFLLLPVTPITIVIGALALGLLWLGTIPLTSALLGRIYGTAYLSTLFGCVFLSHQVGAFFGAWGAGVVVDVLGSYAPVWWAGAFLAFVSAVLHWPIDDRPVEMRASVVAA